MGTEISVELYNEFKQTAALKYHFKRGYTHMALIDAIEDYIKKCKSSK